MLENGKTKFVVKHRAEAIRKAHEDALKELLTDEEKLDFKAFVKKTMGDENTGKEVAWFRQDLTSEYVFRHFDRTRQAEFNKRKAELEKQAMDEFDSLPDMMSQFVLGSDGKLAFAPGSIMEQLTKLWEHLKEESFQLIKRFMVFTINLVQLNLRNIGMVVLLCNIINIFILEL